jgi:hypothetical protein
VDAAGQQPTRVAVQRAHSRDYRDYSVRFDTFDGFLAAENARYSPDRPASMRPVQARAETADLAECGQHNGLECA